MQLEVRNMLHEALDFHCSNSCRYKDDRLMALERVGSGNRHSALSNAT
jgi:hypothetical protein